ncbi:MAG: DUF1080 domain-containing protein [Planctomycetaceae bacterium]
MPRFCRFSLFVIFAVCSTTASAQPFVDLLSDSSLSHWMKPNGDAVDGGWILEPDGTLHLNGKGGNVITRQQYGDFELWFEFRIAQKGNSGIKYRVTDYSGSLLGCEYQILDDAAFPELDRGHLTASLYDVFPTIPLQTRQNPAGQFNIGKVVVHNNRVQHWVNGQLTIDECIGSPRWHEHVSNSKFADKQNFGQNQFGHVMLTDHGSEVWYRNVFIRSLSSPSCPTPQLVQAAQVNSLSAANP